MKRLIGEARGSRKAKGVRQTGEHRYNIASGDIGKRRLARSRGGCRVSIPNLDYLYGRLSTDGDPVALELFAALIAEVRDLTGRIYGLEAKNEREGILGR